MFVWIPRYAYSINEYKVAKDGEGSKQKITNVKFLKGATNLDKDGNSYTTDYNVDDVQIGNKTTMITHPAFKFDGKGLTGIWVAKTEASMLESYDNTEENSNVNNKTVRVVPNVESWRSIQIGNILKNCLNMNKEGNIYGTDNSSNIHLMKNNEWGAVTYFTVSQYGKTPTVNSSGVLGDNGAYHVYTTGRDYINNASQSTTGNVTGIYDLNGAGWEHVAAYYDNTDDNLLINGSEAFFDSNKKLKAEYVKYFDKYEVSQNEITEINNGLWDKDSTYNKTRKSLTTDRYNLMKNIKGDAMYETMKEISYNGKLTDGSYGWLIDESSNYNQYGLSYYNKDFTLISNTKSTFILRGGNFAFLENNGIFATADVAGGVYDAAGFRPTLVNI